MRSLTNYNNSHLKGSQCACFYTLWEEDLLLFCATWKFYKPIIQNHNINGYHYVILKHWIPIKSHIWFYECVYESNNTIFVPITMRCHALQSYPWSNAIHLLRRKSSGLTSGIAPPVLLRNEIIRPYARDQIVWGIWLLDDTKSISYRGQTMYRSVSYLVWVSDTVHRSENIEVWFHDMSRIKYISCLILF